METLNEFEYSGEGTNTRRGGNAGQGNMTAIVGNYSAPMPYRKSSQCTATRAPACRSCFTCLSMILFLFAPIIIIFSILIIIIFSILKLYENFPSKYAHVNTKFKTALILRLTFITIRTYYDYSLNSKKNHIYQSFFQMNLWSEHDILLI